MARILGRRTSVELLPPKADEAVAWAEQMLIERRASQRDIGAELNRRLVALGLDPISKSTFGRYVERLADGLAVSRAGEHTKPPSIEAALTTLLDARIAAALPALAKLIDERIAAALDARLSPSSGSSAEGPRRGSGRVERALTVADVAALLPAPE